MVGQRQEGGHFLLLLEHQLLVTTPVGRPTGLNICSLLPTWLLPLSRQQMQRQAQKWELSHRRAAPLTHSHHLQNQPPPPKREVSVEKNKDSNSTLDLSGSRETPFSMLLGSNQNV